MSNIPSASAEKQAHSLACHAAASRGNTREQKRVRGRRGASQETDSWAPGRRIVADLGRHVQPTCFVWTPRVQHLPCARRHPRTIFIHCDGHGTCVLLPPVAPGEAATGEPALSFELQLLLPWLLPLLLPLLLLAPTAMLPKTVAEGRQQHKAGKHHLHLWGAAGACAGWLARHCLHCRCGHRLEKGLECRVQVTLRASLDLKKRLHPCRVYGPIRLCVLHMHLSSSWFSSSARKAHGLTDDMRSCAQP